MALAVLSLYMIVGLLVYLVGFYRIISQTRFIMTK